jgi:caffeoyl-CoA O-methyltransferase
MDLDDYLARHAGQDEVLARIDRETKAMPYAGMQTSPDQAALLALLVRLSGARTAIEIGTFTGYGAVCIARGLPADGRLTIFEVSDEYAGIARRNLDAAGELDKVTFVMGPATEHLADLDTVDFAYVDADKDAYPAYYDALVPKLAPRGLLLLDNMLRGGRVLDPQDESTRVTAALNDRIAADERVDSFLLGVRDGLTIVTPRAA